jgi:hypothetical protein
MILVIFAGVGPSWLPWARYGPGYLRVRWLGLEIIFYSPAMAREIIRAMEGT